MPSFNPSWHATHDKLPAALAAPDMKKYVPKMVFDTSTYEKMMYYKYTYSKYLNVYQTQLYVWMFFEKHIQIQVYNKKPYWQTAIQPHRHTDVNTKNNVYMK